MNVFRKTGANKAVVRQPRRRIMVAGRDGVKPHSRRPRRPVGLIQEKDIQVNGPEGSLRLCVQRRLGGIGDVLMTTPTVRALKERFPDCHLTYATDPNYYSGELTQILEENPYIDQVVDFKKISQEKFHFFVDITSVCPSKEKKENPPVNRIDMFSEYVGIRLSETLPTYVVREEEKKWCRTIYKKWFGSGSHTVVVIHTASVDNKRTWPIEKYIDLIARATEEIPSLRFVIFDQNRKKMHWDLKNCVNASDFGIREKAALLWGCDVFVGPDSGPMHIAGALNKNMVTLFGSTDYRARINYYDNAIAVTAGKPCAPCWYDRCGHDLACMKELSVDKVLTALVDKLEGNLPVALRDSQRRIVFNVDPTCDMETRHMIKTMVDAFSFVGADVCLASNADPEKDILVDVVRLPSDNPKFVPPLKPALVNYCLMVSPDGTVGKNDAYRLAKGYSGILALSSHPANKLREMGLPTRVTSFSPPVPETSQVPCKEKVFLSITEHIVPENLKVIDSVLSITGGRLDLHCVNYRGISLKNISVYPLKTPDAINRLFSRAWAYLDLNGFGTGWYSTLALAYGIPVITGDYPQCNWIRPDLVFRIPLEDKKPLIEEGSNISCHYSTFAKAQLVETIQSVMNLHEVLRESSLSVKKDIVSESQSMFVPRLLNILSKGIS